MRNILKFIFKVLAKRVIVRYRPTVIGVTGSVGKTTAKEAIFSVLSRRFWVRRNEENFNNEIGVPMTVLGMNPRNKGIGYRLSSIGRSLWLAYGWPKQNYPKMLVLELAADRPGDISYLIEIVKPQVGVVTAIGEVPVHVEFYASPQEVGMEKSKLIAQLSAYDGLAILNYDDQTVLDMKEKSKAKIVTFGLSRPLNGGPDLWASDISYFVDEDNKNIGGLSFKINTANTLMPARINKLVGPHQIYGILAAVAVGLHFGMNLIDISGALENIELPHGRMNLLRGIKNCIIIDDTYNASPLSMHAALDTLRDFSKAIKELGHSGRRIAVLGDMKELGKYKEEAHRNIGTLAAERCDVLVTVGSASKFIADAAIKQIPGEDVLLSYDNSDEARSKIKEMVQEGDVVLVKGSRAMMMEKIVDEISIKPHF